MLVEVKMLPMKRADDTKMLFRGCLFSVVMQYASVGVMVLRGVEVDMAEKAVATR